MKKLVCLLFICLFTGYMAAGQSMINLKGTKISIDTSKWKLNGADIYTKNSGNTGIGIALPLYKLDVSAAANPLRLTGLQQGSATDSVLTVQNGIVRYASIGRMVADSGIYKYDGTLTANRTLTLGGKTLTFATGGTAMKIIGLSGGTTSDSIVTINPATGQLRNIAASRLMAADTSIYKNDGTLTANRTLTLGGKTLTFATGGAAMNISGLTSGAVTDSILTVNASTNRIARITPAQIAKLTTASNGITRDGNDIQLGGTLTKKDTIITSETNTLSLQGLQSGSGEDSLLGVEAGTGAVRKLARSGVNTIKTTYSQTNGYTYMTTINTLSFTAVAGKSYRVKLWLVYNSSSTGNGIRLGPNYFWGGNFWYSTLINTSNTGSQLITGYNSVNILAGTQSRSTSGNVAIIDMTVEADYTSTVSFQFASENNSGYITIQPDSRLQYEVIN